MLYQPAKKGTLLIPSGTYDNPEKKHLFVILTEASPAGDHLLVSISSIKHEVRHDPACEISVGEHRFIN
jgi:hypothetical protein